MARRRVKRRGSKEHLGGQRYRVRIRGRVPDGRVFTHLDAVIHGEAEADRVLEGFRKTAMDLEAGLVPLEEQITLARYVERARRAKGTRKPLVWTPRDQSMWTRMLRPLWNLNLQQLDADRLGGWMEGLERQGYAGNTRKTAWTLLRRIIGHALARKTIVRFPWGDARLALVVESQCREGEGLEDHEWDAICEAAARIDERGGGGALSDLWLRLCVQRMAGSRPVELCMVMRDDLVPTPHGVALRISDGVAAKGGRPGLKPLCETGDPLDVRLGHHLDTMPLAAQRTGLLFPIRRGRRWSHRWALDAKGYRVGRDWLKESEVKALREESGVKGFRPYQLRHTRGTEVAHDEGPQRAQALLGHRVPRTTQRYVHSAARHMTPSMYSTSRVVGGVAATEQLRSAPTITEHPETIRGPGMGPGPSLVTPPVPPASTPPAVLDPDDRADAIRYAEHVLMHGAEATAEAIVCHLGPLDAYALAGDLARVTLAPDLDRWVTPLVSLVAQLRAHARLAATKPTPESSDFVNDSMDLRAVSDSCFTEIETDSPEVMQHSERTHENE